MRHFLGVVTCLLLLASAGAHDIAFGAEPAATVSSGLENSLSAEQIARGRAILKMLTAAIDFNNEQKRWPKVMRELKLESLLGVVYEPPQILAEVDPYFLRVERALLAVCWEDLAAHPDGAWVGFADGHVELARDAKVLGALVNQFRNAKPGIEKNGTRNPIPDAPQIAPEAKIAIKVIDTDGHSIVGAKLDRVGVPSDADGIVWAQYQQCFSQSKPIGTTLVARHADRSLVGILPLEPRAFALQPAPSGLIVTLYPAARLRGAVSVLGSPAPLDEIHSTVAYLYRVDNLRSALMSSVMKDMAFDLGVPPGEYVLGVYRHDTFQTYRFVNVTAQQSEVAVQLDLPAAPIAKLRGSAAPELQSIKEWKNGKATTLKQLRGKWVLVDFWAHWCGPCIGAMPELMKLHDDFGDKGLAVITVHEDSVASIAEMDEKIQKSKESYWKGRDLPFFVALDGGGEQRMAGTDLPVKGTTNAAYGVQRLPNTILIDPEGNVVGERDVRNPELRKFLEEKLGAAK